MPDPKDRVGSAFPAWLVMGFAFLNLAVLFTELGANIVKSIIPG